MNNDLFGFCYEPRFLSVIFIYHVRLLTLVLREITRKPCVFYIQRSFDGTRFELDTHFVQLIMMYYLLLWEICKYKQIFYWQPKINKSFFMKIHQINWLMSWNMDAQLSQMSIILSTSLATTWFLKQYNDNTPKEKPN